MGVKNRAGLSPSLPLPGATPPGEREFTLRARGVARRETDALAPAWPGSVISRGGGVGSRWINARSVSHFCSCSPRVSEFVGKERGHSHKVDRRTRGSGKLGCKCRFAWAWTTQQYTEHRPKWLRLQNGPGWNGIILIRKMSFPPFPPPSTLDQIHFSSLDHKTSYLDSSNFRNRSRDLL